MKTIKQEEYTKLNKALHGLEDLLASMGIREFSLSRDKHNVQMDMDADNIDTGLLKSFCRNIERMHDAKFGKGIQQH